MSATVTPRASVSRAANDGSLAGTGTLIRFILRRDRIRIPIWIAAIVGSALASVSSITDLFESQADFDARAQLMESPLGKVLAGPGYGLDNYGLGPMVANEYMLWAIIAVAFMSLLLVVRHTRAEEELDRTEMLRASVVGRHAPVTAVTVVAIAVNVVIGIVMALGLLAMGQLDTSGSLLLSASVATGGVVFTGVAVLAVQVSGYSRGALGLGAAVLGAAVVLRAVGDLGEGTLSWLSPIGWSQATRAYVDERWWPLLLSVGAAALLVWLGMYLSTRRDVGAGLRAIRPGRAAAADSLVRPLGLAFRLNRANLLGWCIGMVLFGIGIGSTIQEIGEFVSSSPEIAEIFSASGVSIQDTFLGTLMLYGAVLAAGYAVQTMMKLRSEESGGRAEPVIVASVSRTRWVGSHLTVAVIGSALVLMSFSLAMGFSAAIVEREGSYIADLVGAGLAYVPALAVIIGVVVALFGLAPRAVMLGWIPIVVSIVAILSQTFELPEWTQDLSPITHVPMLPGAEFTATPLSVLSAIAVALIGAGLVGFRRRSINAS